MTMTQPKDPKTTLADLLDMIVRYRWRLIVPAFLVAALVLAGGLLLPRKYKAEAVFERRTRMVLEQITAKGAPESMDTSKPSLIEEITGSTAIDELITAIEPQVAPRFVARTGEYDRRDLHEGLTRGVIVTPVLSSKSLDRINISYVAEDPVVAQLVVNTLVENYIDRTRLYVADRLQETAAFFEKEVAGAKEQIEALENRQLNFQLEHAELMPDENGHLQHGISALEVELSAARQSRDSAQVRVQKLRESLEETPVTEAMDVTAPNPELKELLRKRTALEEQATSWTSQLGMTELHPDMIALRAQVVSLTRQIGETDGLVVTEQHVSANPKHRQLDVMLADAVAEAEALENRVATLEGQVARLSADSEHIFPVLAEYKKLTRDIEERQRRLTFWEDNLSRIRLTQAAESSQSGMLLDFIKPCTEINKPVSPYLSQVVLAALLLGLMAGGVGVFTAYRTDETFLGGEQVSKAVGLPLFGSVSEIISRQRRQLRHVRNLILYPTGALAMAAVLSALMAALYVSLEQPAGPQPASGTPAQQQAPGDAGDPDARLQSVSEQSDV